jgi:hypothetical protein
MEIEKSEIFVFYMKLSAERVISFNKNNKKSWEELMMLT